MPINYTIFYRPSNTTGWTSLGTFKRDIFSEDPLDETLDTGTIDLPLGELIIIPPFSYIKIIATYADGTTETKYMLLSDYETEAKTLFENG